MYSNMKWILRFVLTVFVALVLPAAALAQTRIFVRQSWLVPDEARDIFNAGLRSYDEYRFSDAENKFREVIRRFPRNAIEDRSDYYLIRTLAQLGKKTEALNRIDSFARQYPKSHWLDDVQEFRIQLTNQIPPKGETILFTSAPAPPQSPSPFVAQVVAPPAPPAPAVPPV